MNNRHLVLERILPNAYMALGYYLWISDYKHALRDSVLTGEFAHDFGVRVETDYMEFGLAEGSLVAFRKFDDFFGKKPKKKRDDLHVSDFFPDAAFEAFLKEEERESINKTVAHLTSFVPNSGRGDTQILSMTRRFIDTFVVFCDLIVDSNVGQFVCVSSAYPYPFA